LGSKDRAEKFKNRGNRQRWVKKKKQYRKGALDAEKLNRDMRGKKNDDRAKEGVYGGGHRGGGSHHQRLIQWMGGESTNTQQKDKVAPGIKEFSELSKWVCPKVGKKQTTDNLKLAKAILRKAWGPNWTFTARKRGW